MIVIFQVEVGQPMTGHIIRKSINLPTPPSAGDYVTITEDGWTNQVRSVDWDISGEDPTALVDIEPQRLDDPLEVDSLVDSALHCDWELLR